MDLEEFLEEFDEVSNLVSRTRNEDFSRMMRRWFAVLDEAPDAVRGRVRWLMTLQPWVGNEDTLTKEESGMGNSELLWPDAKEPRLSAQLNLFREFADDRIEAWRFADEYFADSVNNIDYTLHRMTEHLFDPHVAELRRYLIRKAEAPVLDIIEVDDGIPASDRIVHLDHNNAGYDQTVAAIEEASAALIGDNAIDPGDRDRIKFELDSGILLLKAQSVRVSAMEAVLIHALKWVSQNFAGAALGIAAEHALVMVLKLIAGG